MATEKEVAGATGEGDVMESEAKRLVEIKERVEKATPTTITRYEHGGGRIVADGQQPDRLVADVYDEANREFYFNAREDVPYLLALVQAQEQEIAQLKDAFNGATENILWKASKICDLETKLAGLLSAANNIEARSTYFEKRAKDTDWQEDFAELGESLRVAISEAEK